MKSIITLLLLCTAAASVCAQPTLTAATSTPAIGVRYYGYRHNDFTKSAGSGTTNQTWDVTGANYFSPFGNKVVACSTVSNCGSFPTATIVLKDTLAGSKTTFLRGSSTALSSIGEDNYYAFSDPDDILHFPMSYGTSYADAFKGAKVGGTGSPFYRIGTDSVQADGWGTLKTPAGTFSNTLRIKRILTYKDSVAPGPMYEWKVISYTFYSQSYKLPLFYTDSAHWTYMGTSGDMKSSSYIAGQGAANTTGAGITTGSQISACNMYPMPATEVVHVDLNLLNPASVRLVLTDVLGRQMRQYESIQASTSQRITLDVKGLTAGVYTLRIYCGQSMIARQIVTE